MRWLSRLRVAQSQASLATSASDETNMLLVLSRIRFTRYSNDPRCLLSASRLTANSRSNSVSRQTTGASALSPPCRNLCLTPAKPPPIPYLHTLMGFSICREEMDYFQLPYSTCWHILAFLSMLFKKAAVMHFTVKLVFKTAPYLSPPEKSRPPLQVPLNTFICK